MKFSDGIRQEGAKGSRDTRLKRPENEDKLVPLLPVSGSSVPTLLELASSSSK